MFINKLFFKKLKRIYLKNLSVSEVAGLKDIYVFSFKGYSQNGSTDIIQSVSQCLLPFSVSEAEHLFTCLSHRFLIPASKGCTFFR